MERNPFGMWLGMFLVGTSACGAFERSTVDPSAIAAVVVSRNEPPRGCESLGEVTGDVILGELASAQRDLLRNAAAGGGNYVALDMTERHPGGYGVRGRLFLCPAEPHGDWGPGGPGGP